jgi:hypothetical protein
MERSMISPAEPKTGQDANTFQSDLEPGPKESHMGSA